MSHSVLREGGVQILIMQSGAWRCFWALFTGTGPRGSGPLVGSQDETHRLNITSEPQPPQPPHVSPQDVLSFRDLGGRHV